MDKNELKKQAEKWIKDGKPCVFRQGWAYRGASARPISNEEALQLLPNYEFDRVPSALSFIKYQGKEVLEFNKLSGLDME